MFYSNKTNTSNRAQIAIPYSKADSIYHRYYYDGSWSAWKSSAYVGAQKVLWSGGHYMNEYQTATLSESISSQNNGIVLVFSAYDNEAQNYDFVTYFVPKYHVSAHNYSNVQVPLFGDNFWKNSVKHLAVSDTSIVGYVNNVGTGTQNGITYDNNRFVLRYVIGV